MVHVSDDLLSYIIAIAEATRVHPDIMLGVSPRGTQSLLRAIQGLAILRGRTYATPDDIKEMVLPVMAHRIVVKGALKLKAGMAEELLLGIMKKIPVPSEEFMKND